MGQCRIRLLSYNDCLHVISMFEINQNWYVLFLGFLLPWLILTISRRKSMGMKEIKEQVIIACLGLCVLTLMEVYAVSSDLWHYVPGDWPVILWPTYFVAILFGYQLLRFLEANTKKI